MTLVSRRIVIFGALAGGVALALPARAQELLAVPKTPMRLIRRIERELSDGAQIVVERCWDISFASLGLGTAITGQQVQVAVDAPAALSRLASIEEQRSTEGMFPILLSESGLIITEGEAVSKEDVAEAVREAARLIDQRAISADAKAEQIRYLALMQKGAGKLLERMPADLFFPASPPLHSIQPINLENGVKGEFEVLYTAQCAPRVAWLGKAERNVVTRIGASERRSREVWTMAPI